MRSTVLQVRGCKWQFLLGVKLWGLRCNADVDREKYFKCSRGADSGQKLLMWCRHKFSVRTISSLDFTTAVECLIKLLQQLVKRQIG